jgi:hypothetical protein
VEEREGTAGTVEGREGKEENKEVGEKVGKEEGMPDSQYYRYKLHNVV